MSFVKRVGAVLGIILTLLVIMSLYSLKEEKEVSQEVVTEAVTEKVEEKDVFLRDKEADPFLEKELELENEISLWIDNALLSSRSRAQSLDSSEADVAATYVEEYEESYEEESYEESYEEEHYEEEVYSVEEDYYEESYEEEYYEETEEDSYHSTGSYTLSDLQYHGVINWNGNRYTYYSQQVLPGGGLKIPGRHVNAGGFVSDGDGYIVLANDVLDRGTVVSTPFGYYGKIYDRFGTGKPSHHFDVYTQ